MNSKLAIVIPAYKKQFLYEALESISRQSCLNFTVYIGDDGSLENLFEVIKPFESKMKIVYNYFPENYGSKNLISHWNRCMRLIQNEEWVWFFSDDDKMGVKCVEYFFDYINKKKYVDLVHFNVEVIDSLGLIKNKVTNYPAFLSVEDFFERKLSGQLESFVVEYIFKREVFYQNNGFQEFDLAWCSDDATWIKLGRVNGIHTVEGAIVQWRYSGMNISSILNNNQVVFRKTLSMIRYLLWVKDYFYHYNLSDKVNIYKKIIWVLVPLKQYLWAFLNLKINSMKLR